MWQNASGSEGLATSGTPFPMLDNLGNASMRRLERFGESEDVEQAIASHRSVVNLIPESSFAHNIWRRLPPST